MSKQKVMETVIRLRPEELTDAFLQDLKQLANHANRVEIRLNGMDAVNGLSETEIANRLRKLSEGKTVSFSFEDLQAHVQKIAG